MNNRLIAPFFIIICIFLSASLLSCGKETGGEKDYIKDDSGNAVYFTLELRMPVENTERASGDVFSHSALGGEVIRSFEVPYFGETVYDSVVKFFENRVDRITFSLSEHIYYMFDEYVSGEERYSLKTAYIAANGEYSSCANYEMLSGEDKTLFTDDDLKILTIVYKGWLY